MATKTIGKWRIELYGEGTPVAPYTIHVEAQYTISGLPEIGSRSILLTSTIPNDSVTIAQIISGARSAIISALQNEGQGGHTVL